MHAFIHSENFLSMSKFWSSGWPIWYLHVPLFRKAQMACVLVLPAITWCSTTSLSAPRSLVGSRQATFFSHQCQRDYTKRKPYRLFFFIRFESEHTITVKKNGLCGQERADDVEHLAPNAKQYSGGRSRRCRHCEIKSREGSNETTESVWKWAWIAISSGKKKNMLKGGDVCRQ